MGHNQVFDRAPRSPCCNASCHHGLLAKTHSLHARMSAARAGRHRMTDRRGPSGSPGVTLRDPADPAVPRVDRPATHRSPRPRNISAKSQFDPSSWAGRCPGTDLDQARWRWVIERATVAHARTPAQVDAMLMVGLGIRERPEQTDAFVLQVESIEPHPGWPLQARPAQTARANPASRVRCCFATSGSST